MKKSLLPNSSLLAFLFLIYSIRATAQTVIPAEMPSSFDVSSTGAFTYSLPIQIPPGIKDMMPNLAITYNSQGGNSMMGIGWSLSGLSAITRSGTTIFHHQQLDPADFDGNDVFVLDGQRLIETSPGIYMTEIKNFAKIQSFGSMGSGPAFFTVEYPNGLVFEYGNSISSQIQAHGKQSVLVWAVNRISDRKGNYVEFNYYNSGNATGESRITSIRYGLNTNAPASVLKPVEIRFSYISRPDNNISWVRASGVKDNVLLNKIEVADDLNNIVNTYQFTYSSSAVLLGAHLEKIEENRNGKQLPPVIINWGQHNGDLSVISANSKTGGYWYVMGDFNGDGGTDYVKTVASNAATNSMTLWNSDKNGDFTSVPAATQPLPYSPVPSYVKNVPPKNGSRFTVDYNGDGLDDVIHVDKQEFQMVAGGSSLWSSGFIKLHLYTSTENGFVHSEIFHYSNVSGTQFTTPHYLNNTRIIPGDFDGDRKTDVMVLIPSDLTAYNEGQLFDCFIVGQAYPNGGTNPNLGNYGTIVSGDWREVGKIQHEIYASMPLDYDGDGKHELLTTGSNIPTEDAEIWQLSPTYTGDIVTSPGSLNVVYYDTYPSHRTRIKFPSNNSIKPGEYQYNIWPGDFNGDGKDDLLTFTTTGTYGTPGIWQIAYSTGLTGTSGGGWVMGNNSLPLQELFNAGPWLFLDYGYHVADFNGDGKDDILQLSDPNTQFHPGPNIHYTAYYSIGVDHFRKESNTLPPDVEVWTDRHWTGDFNGDGQIDIMYDRPNIATPTVFSIRTNDNTNQVASIEHAGKKIEVTTKTISSATPDVGGEDHYGYNDDSYFDWSLNTPDIRPDPYYTRQIPIKVVTKLKDNISLHKDYYYETIDLHRTGLGLLCFEKIQVKDYDNKTITENKFSLRPFWGRAEPFSHTAFLYETNIYPLSDPANLMLQKEYNYRDVPGDVTGKVRIIVNNDIIETNNATGSYTDAYTEYDLGSQFFFDFGVPVFTLTDRGVHNSHIRDSVIFGYDTNLPFHNRSKPVSITKSCTYPQRPTYRRTTGYRYNADGLLVQLQTDPGTTNQNITYYTYDGFGNMVTSQLTAGGLTPVEKSYTYSPDGKFRLANSEYLGTTPYTDVYEYDLWGKVKRHVAPNTLETQYFYDDINRLTRILDPYDVQTFFEYDWAYNNINGDNPPGNFTNYQVITQNTGAAQLQVRTTTTSPAAKEKTEFFDFYGRTLRTVTTGFAMGFTPYIYTDAQYQSGRLHTSTLPYPKGGAPVTTTYLYDEYGREVERSSTTGPTITTSYIVSTAPRFLQTTVTNTSASPSQVKVTYANTGGVYYIDDNGNAIEFEYASNGKPETVRINNQFDLKHVYQYDDFGRVTHNYASNSAVTSYNYNAYGQVIRETIPGGGYYEYTYDGLGRVTSKIEKNGSNKGFYYSYYNIPNLPETGQLKQESTDYAVNGNTVSKTYIYNIKGRLWKLIDQVDLNHTYLTQYEYTQWGAPQAITYPNNILAYYFYEGHGYLRSVGASDLTTNTPLGLYQVAGANHFGQTTASEYWAYPATGGQIIYTGERTYDDLGYPQARKVSLVATPLDVASFGYVFDQATGNLQSREDMVNGLTEDFQYDVFDRLTDVTSSTTVPPLHMEYDAHGNIMKKNDVTSSPYNWMYNLYALTTVPDVSMSSNAVQLQSVRQPFTQEAEHYPFKRVKWLREGPNEVHFTYGADLQRVKAEYNPGGLPGQKERYYSGNYEVTEENGNVTRVNYITAGDELIGIVHDNNGTLNFRFVVTDHLGSITHLLDDKGIVNNGVVEERSYDAWGRPRKPTNWTYFGPGIAPGWTIDRGYTGHEHIFTDGTFDNSVINMNGRLYDPLIGRMFSPDPYVGNQTSTESYNKYSYVNNNPLKYTDPTGEIPAAAVPFIVMAVVGAGTNVVSHWGNIVQNPWSAFGYAGVGATAGAMSVADPVSAGLILASGNVLTDVVFGTTPDLSSTHNKVEYGIGIVTDFMGARAAGAVGTGSSAGYGWDWFTSTKTIYNVTPDPGTVAKGSHFINEMVEITAKKVYHYGGSIGAKTGTSLVRTGTQYTKSNLQLGQEMHRTYKVGADGIKEFRLPSGKRIDFLDINNRTIYELKPFNPRGMREGQRQLNMYLKELQSIPEYKGSNWKTVLDTY